jgi:hypothetical protein
MLSTLGVLMPNDQAKGRILDLNPDLNSPLTIVDSLQRPTFFFKSDMDENGYDDFIVCEYGNYTGYLTVFEST